MNIFSMITLRNLLKNRTRTTVTIIGIALSAALFTAVTTSVSTLFDFMTRYIAYNNGSWHGAGYTMTDEELTQLRNESATDKIVTIQNIGFADPGNSENEAKPYIFIAGIDSDFTELMPVHITEGRMPENDTELLLPKHLSVNGGITHQIGDVLNLEVGSRVDEGYALNNHQPFTVPSPEEDPAGKSSAEDSDDESSAEDPADGTDSPSSQNGEALENTVSHTYTVVGFYERPAFEDFVAPGYTALTFTGSSSAADTYDAYFTLHRSSKTSSFLQKNDSLFPGGSNMNTRYLRTRGSSGEVGIDRMLRGLAVILIGIIAFGSISLIYNAFSISVNERTKQFGMLSSIGATKKQLRHSVMTEGILLGIIGIPIGLVIGLVGIGITFHFVGSMMTTALLSDSNIAIIFHPSFVAMGIAILVSFVTIMLSALIPAKRATKISAIDAIRQTQDIRIKGKKLKTSRLTQKLLGFEGTLATKYYKRNRKKYRSTVISLFMSIVLFISASSFAAYLTKSVNSVYDEFSYDVSGDIWSSHPFETDTLNDFCKSLENLEEVLATSYNVPLAYQNVLINEEALSDPYRKEYSSRFATSTDLPDGTASILCQVVFLADDSFRQLIKENHVSEDGYFDKGALKALCCNQMTDRDEDGHYHVYEPIRSLENAGLQMNFAMGTDEDGDFNPTGTRTVPIQCDTIIDQPKDILCPFTTNFRISLYLPYSSIAAIKDALNDETLISEVDYYNQLNRVEFCISTADHAKTAKQLHEMILKLGKDDPEAGYSIQDYANDMETERTMLFIANVFAYGFIILISLITVANVFNTLNTNVNLRRREFAMLRSIGMAPKGFTRMMNYECILYGFKSLLYGLPASILVTYLIYNAVSNEIEMAFFVPWYSILIAVGSVFIVVFATMIYSMNKVSKENTIDALKNENL